MEHRKLGKTGLAVSAISLGTEYLLNQSREHVAGVIHEAIDLGVNYFDLFWPQPEFRDNLGAAFAGRRERVMLAAHLGAVMRNGQEEKTRDLKACRTFFEDFLTRYHTDYVDVLFLHNIDEQADYDEVMRPGGMAELGQAIRREGRARLIGFSGHTVATSLQAVESGVIDLLMFPVNLAGHAVPGKKDLFRACAAKGVGLVAMKPFAGGKLLLKERIVAMENFQVGGAPQTIEKPRPITPAQCLAYVLAQSGLSTIVPGCKSVEEVRDVQGYWETTPEERDYSSVVTDFAKYTPGECVYCNHCLPCPSVIDIGQLIRLLETVQRRMTDELRSAYGSLGGKASDCIHCGQCTERCPFGVDVETKMEQAMALFE
jgi:hypothetical protein